MPALDADRLEAFVTLAFADPVSPERLEGLRLRLDDPAWAARRRYVCDDRGHLVAVTWMVPDDHGRGLVLVAPRSGGPIDARAATLVDEAVTTAREQDWGRVSLQVSAGGATDALVAACRRTGAREGPGRIEFEAPLDGLVGPTVPGQLRFEPAPDEASAAEVLDRCARGSPDSLEPGQSAAQAIRVMLRRPGRTNQLARVIHLGRLDGEVVAFVCAQIRPADGWSTITLLALHPAVRGRGLGAELHRHGLAMLRAQGGRLYRGGTSLANLPMRRCFERNGVPEVARYREWRWALSPRPPGGSS